MPVLTREQKIAKGKRLAAAQSTPVLIESLVKLGEQIDAEREVAMRTQDYGQIQALNMTRHWVVETLENRYPEASAAVGKAYDEAPEDADLDYNALLIAAIPENEK